MSIITKAVSRFECRDFQRIQAEARAAIALHHFTRFTGGKPALTRLSEGLLARGITRNLSQQEGVERALRYLHLKLQNPATGKVTGF